MMKNMIEYLKKHNYSKISLSVQKNNYASKMYLALGFKIIKEDKDEYIMTYCLN